jgi:hypothetical protein
LKIDNKDVILSEAGISLREISAQSKDPLSPNRITLVVTLFLALLFSALASAQTLTGTVKNATTDKPAAGDDVVLLKLGEGMEEAGRTKTDSQGRFSFKLDDAQTPHLVRAIHQEVTYHRMAPPGTTSVELEVYDAAKKVDGITVVADIMRVQADQGQLVVVREFGVHADERAQPRVQCSERCADYPRFSNCDHPRRKPAEVSSCA